MLTVKVFVDFYNLDFIRKTSDASYTSLEKETERQIVKKKTIQKQ